jgi:CheY-specific phosphatase CheX
MKQAMMRSISDVLEQMFFLPVDAHDPQQWYASIEPDQAPNHLTVSIDFDGPSAGRFWLSIPLDLATIMAVDFLGTSSDELSPDHISATAKELINMLAGNTLSAYDPESAFNLDCPEVFSTATDSTPDSCINLIIETPENRLTFHLSIHTTGKKPGPAKEEQSR